MSHSIIVADTARFTCLAPGLVRMEFCPEGVFEDRRSVRAATRPDGVPFAAAQTDSVPTRLDTGEMIIEYSPDGRPFHAGNLRALNARDGQVFWDPERIDTENLGGVHVSMDYAKQGMLPHGVHPATFAHHHIGSDQNLWSFGRRLYSDPSDGIGDGANLPALFDEVLATRDFDKLPKGVRDLMLERWKYPPGILSRAGFYLYNDTSTTLLDVGPRQVVNRPDRKGYLDVYLFYYRKDFKQALADYRLLFGETPLMPRYALGLWYSRYPTLREAEIYELAESFEQHDLPMDMFVFDLEWHQRGWNGFDWDINHFPTPDKLLSYLRERDIHTTFNIHPECVPIDDSRFDDFLAAAGLTCDKDSIQPDRRGVKTFDGYDVSIPRQAKAFMDVLHKPIQDQGVDFWWIDGGCPANSLDTLDRQFWTNHVYYSHIRDTYPERRPMIFSRAPGLGAHRYPFHFTADTWSYWETLANQVEQTLRAGHIGQSYITHDIGGHLSTSLYIDPELYMRWVQFAVLSPIIRLHSSKISDTLGGERRPWMYGEFVLASFHHAMRFRMELLPYLYALVKETQETGLPICRSNCIERPEWEAGYEQWDAYFLGDRIYAAPVTRAGTMRDVILPPGRWHHGLTGEIIDSDGLTPRTEVSPFKHAPLHYIRAGTLLPRQPYAHRATGIPDRLRLDIYTNGAACEDRFTLYEDDGTSQRWTRGEFATRVIGLKEEGGTVRLEIAAAKGSYAGMPQTRMLEILLHGKKAKSARIDGVAAEPDEAGAILLPGISNDQSCLVEVVTE